MSDLNRLIKIRIYRLGFSDRFFRAVERGQSKAAITNKQTKTGAMSNFGLLVIRSKFEVFRKILVLASKLHVYLGMISNSIKILKSLT